MSKLLNYMNISPARYKDILFSNVLVPPGCEVTMFHRLSGQGPHCLQRKSSGQVWRSGTQVRKGWVGGVWKIGGEGVGGVGCWWWHPDLTLSWHSSSPGSIWHPGGAHWGKEQLLNTVFHKLQPMIRRSLLEAAGNICNNKFERDSRELLEVSHKQCLRQNFQGSGENKMQIRMFSQKVKQRANLLYVASCAGRLKIFLTLASFWICGQNIDNMYPSDRNELQCDHHIHVVEDDFMLVQSKTIAAKCGNFAFVQEPRDR